MFAQLDFRIEARNNRRFRANFRGTPTSCSPRWSKRSPANAS